MVAKSALTKMNKKQLEEYGRSIGVEVDRRLKKAIIIQQILEYEAVPTTIESIVTRPDRVHSSPLPDERSTPEIEKAIASLPKYTGDNSGKIGQSIMKLLPLVSGHKVQFGPDEDQYVIRITGLHINKQWEL